MRKIENKLVAKDVYSYQKCSNVDHIHPTLLPGDVGGSS